MIHCLMESGQGAAHTLSERRKQAPGGILVIHGADMSFSYDFDEYTSVALDGVGIEIKPGEMIVVLGQNGSGKSTLAKHFNALLPIQKGKLTVMGINVRDEDEIWRLRRQCGMVFQNPDNQFVASTVEEDVAFGLENYETPRDIIPDKVASALNTVGMDGYEKRDIHTLSGGQKQRLALASVLALDPDIVIFDEVTSMLDSEGRLEIIEAIKRLHNQRQKTMIMITHYVEEAVSADRVCLMHKGRILGYGTPSDILTNMELMKATGLLPPVPVRLYYDLKEMGITLNSCPLNTEGLAEEICRLL